MTICMIYSMVYGIVCIASAHAENRGCCHLPMYMRTQQSIDEIMHARNVDNLCALIKEEHQVFDAVNVNAAWRQLLLPQGHGGAQSSDSRRKCIDASVTTLLHRAIQLLRHENQHGATVLDSRGQAHSRFGPREISNMAHALAKSGRPLCHLCEQLIEALELRSLSLIHEFNGQDIGNMLYVTYTPHATHLHSCA